MYVSPHQLSSRPGGSLDLAQLFELPLELWDATLAAGDRTAFSALEIAAADAALIAVTEQCEAATGEVNAYLSQRGYLLPADVVKFPVLMVWTRAFALYHLHPHREALDEGVGRIERDYRDARRALLLVAGGALSLGAGDPLAPVNSDSADADAGRVRITARPRLFSRGTLGGL